MPLAQRGRFGRSSSPVGRSDNEVCTVWDSFVDWFVEWQATWRGTIVVCLLLLGGGYSFVWWWTGPVYAPHLMTITNLTLNGVSVGKTLPPVVAGREFTMTCTIRSNGKKLLAVDSAGVPYLGFILNEAACKQAFEQNKLDPVFTLAFTSIMRAGRNLRGATSLCSVKVDPTGETAELSVKSQAPLSSGRYPLKIELLSCEGRVKKADGSFTFKPGKIVWRTPVSVNAK